MNTATGEEPLIGKPEVAKMMKQCLRTVDNLVRDRRIPFVKLGRSVRFRPADVRRFIDSHVIQSAA